MMLTMNGGMRHKVELLQKIEKPSEYSVKIRHGGGYQNNADVVGAINALKRGREILAAQ